MYKVTFLALVMALTAFADSDEPTINVYFKSSTIVAGQETDLVITTTQKPLSDMSTLIPPHLAITTQYIGASVRTEVINFSATTLYEYHYRASSNDPGRQVLPRFEITFKKVVLKTPETALNVLDANSVPPEQRPINPKLVLDVPPGPIYSGQVFPVIIKLQIPNHAKINPLSKYPYIESDSFASNSNFSNRVKRPFTDDEGIVHYEFVWITYLTALKSGPQNLNFELPIEIVNPPKRRVVNTLQDLFNSSLNSMFDDFHATEATQRLLTTEPLSLNITELPSHGRPDSFNGAIGDFSLSKPILDVNEIHEGDPITLTLSIRGEGNFNRFNTLELTDSESFKNYKPKSYFKAASPLEYEGEKIFEYILIPNNSAIQATPTVEFSYFDPESGQYHTLQSETLPLAITPSSLTLPQLANQPPSTAEDLGSDTSTLVDIQLQQSTNWLGYTPIVHRPAFYLAQILPTLAFIIFTFKRVKAWKMSHQPILSNQEKQLLHYKKSIKELKKAVHKNQAPEAYRAFNQALNHYIASKTGVQGESWTRDETITHLQSLNLEEASLTKIDQLLSTAESLRYAGTINDTHSIKELESTLNRLPS